MSVILYILLLFIYILNLYYDMHTRYFINQKCIKYTIFFASTNVYQNMRRFCCIIRLYYFF